MIRVTQVNMSTPRNKEWLCCFGLHVRTATIIIGTWHLCLNILALGVLSVIVRNPTLIHELQGTTRSDNVPDQEVHPALPTPLSKVEPPYRDHDMNYQHMDMSGLMYLCLIAISSMLVYGALKGKRSYLLPFFCLQLFDFAITTLTAVNFRQVHRLLESQRLPLRDELLELSPQTLSIVVLVAYITVVMLKAYAIGIVWRCYKYITLQRQTLATMLPYLIPDVNLGTMNGTGRMERDYSSLLPDYDEAISQGLKQAPPPSYSMAMSVNGHVVLNDELPSRSTDNTTPAVLHVEAPSAVDSQAPPTYEGAAAATISTASPPITVATTNTSGVSS